MAYTVVSASVLNLDAIPVVRNTAGIGGPGELKGINDFVAVTTGQLGATTTKLQMVRLPTTVKIKRLRIESDVSLAASTLAVDVGAYYSDATNDGTAAANQGKSVGGAVNQFGAAVSFANAAPGNIDVTPIVQDRNMPLWQFLGLTTDPGGNFDIVIAVHTAATTPAPGSIGCQVDYVW